jgi:hypothetical protein
MPGGAAGSQGSIGRLYRQWREVWWMSSPRRSTSSFVHPSLGNKLLSWPSNLLFSFTKDKQTVGEVFVKYKLAGIPWCSPPVRGVWHTYRIEILPNIMLTKCVLTAVETHYRLFSQVPFGYFFSFIQLSEYCPNPNHFWANILWVRTYLNFCRIFCCFQSGK